MAKFNEGEQICRKAASLRARPGEPGNLERAESLFREAVQRYHGFWMCHYGLGELLLFKARDSGLHARPAVDEALSELRKAEELAPTQPEPALQLAAHYVLVDMWEAKRRWIDATGLMGLSRGYTMSVPVGLYPATWQAWAHWQFALGQDSPQGHDSVAVSAFECAIALNPKEYSERVRPLSSRSVACWEQAKRLRRVTVDAESLGQ